MSVRELATQWEWFDLIPHIVWAASADGRVHSVNSRASEYTGLSAEQLLDGQWNDVVHPDDLGRARASWAHATHTGEPFYSEHRLRRGDGRFLWHAVRGVPLREDDGRIILWLGTATDVHSQKSLEQSLHDAEADQAMLAAIVESSDDAIISTRLDRTVLTWNAGATALYGYEAEEVVGNNVSVLIPADRLDEMTAILGRIAAGEVVRHIETVRIHKDGSHVPVALAVWPLKDRDGRLIGASSLAHDISERQRLRTELEEAHDAALRALQAKSQFLANTSHELRTPLTAIMGMTDLLLRTTLDDDQRQMADAVKRSAEKLLGIVVTVLDVSAVTNGNLALDLGAVEVQPLVDDVRDFVAPRALAKGLRLACTVDDDVPPTIHGDPVRLRQMLRHLSENAVKFTDRGNVAIRVGRPEGAEVSCVRFMVVDTGIGVPPRDQWRLFRVFSQVDPTDTRRFGGNGLGLALVARLAEAMEGTVGVASSAGRGSTFWFDIPVASRGRGNA